MGFPTGSNVLGEAKKGWTAPDLFRSGVRVSKGRENPKPSGIRTLKNVVPYVGTKSVLMQVLSIGVSLPWMTYQTDLMFSDIEFTHDDTVFNDREWIEIKYQMESVYMKKIDLRRCRVKVRCSCPDFYFTFSWQDWNQGALFGSKPKRYIRKTIWNPLAPEGQRGYPPRNPDNHAGMCKHAYNAIQLIQQNGWISNSSRLG